MGTVNDSDLRTNIRNGKLDRVYYFYGKDISAVEQYKKLAVSKAVKKDDEVYNLHAFEGKNLDMDEFTNACEALPMFADYVCCTVCDLNAETLSAESLNWLVKFIGDLPETTVLIFYNTSVDVTDGKKYPTSKNKKLIDAASKAGSVCCFSYKTPAILSRDIIASVSKKGASITKNAAVYLAELCCCNTMMIGNEIAKLTAYVGNGEITENTVSLLCPRQIETTTFDLARAVTRQDRNTSMRLLNDLVSEKIEPISILYSITSNMLDLYRARVAIGCGKSPSDVIEDFAYSKNLEFRVTNAFRDVRSLSVKQLRECMKILTETDVAIKSINTDGNILLEEAIIKMMSVRR